MYIPNIKTEFWKLPRTNWKRPPQNTSFINSLWKASRWRHVSFLYVYSHQFELLFLLSCFWMGLGILVVFFNHTKLPPGFESRVSSCGLYFFVTIVILFNSAKETFGVKQARCFHKEPSVKGLCQKPVKYSLL